MQDSPAGSPPTRVLTAGPLGHEVAQPGLKLRTRLGPRWLGLLAYLQPGVFTVCPGGWHFAPPSFGPLLLLPGPKSGSAKAGAAVMDRAATARIDAIALRRMRPPSLEGYAQPRASEAMQIPLRIRLSEKSAICTRQPGRKLAKCGLLMARRNGPLTRTKGVSRVVQHHHHHQLHRPPGDGACTN